MKKLYRVMFYVIGLFILSLGVVVSINSNLGVSPTNSFPYAVSRASGVRMGLCVTIIFCFYILLQIIILRREFQIKNLFQIVFSTVFGYFVDLWKLIIGTAAIPTYAGKLLMLVLSIAFIAVGLTLVLTPDLVPMPSEGLCLAVSKKLPQFKFHNVKLAFDCASVTLAIAISLIFCGNIDGLREGTIISALLVGKVLGVCMKYLSPKIKAICF